MKIKKVTRTALLFLILSATLYSCKEKVDPFGVPTLRTNEVMEITSFTAIVEGEIISDGGSEVTERGFVWSRESQPTLEQNEGKVLSLSTVVFNSGLNNLRALSNYYVRAFATNSSGTAYANELQFESSDIFIDKRDGRKYTLVKIDDRLWIKENMKYLPVVSEFESSSTSEARYYVYGYKGVKWDEAVASDSFENYGVLYNWHAAMKACPEGWQLPSDGAWAEMVFAVGDRDNAGSKLKHTAYWNSPNTDANNNSGFSALPGGYRSDEGSFDAVGTTGQWWSSTNYNNGTALSNSLHHNSPAIIMHESDLSEGFSVRCVKN